jgi:hypothetical protein
MHRVPRTGEPGRLPPRACRAALLPRWWRSRGCASSAEASRDSVLPRLGVPLPAGGRAAPMEPEPADDHGMSAFHVQDQCAFVCILVVHATAEESQSGGRRMK